MDIGYIYLYNIFGDDMSKVIDDIIKRAKNNKKRIVLPESMDRRILEACSIVLKENIADIILIGREKEILKNSTDLNISDATIIDPSNSELTDKYIDMLYNLRKDKGLSREEAKELLYSDYMYFACMLVKDGMADGIVSGACHSTSNTLRPALQILKTKPGVSFVSSFFLMVVPNCDYGDEGVFLFADCGLEQNPTSEKLADIAGVSASSFELLVGHEARVAMLSHSTMGSAKHSDVDKVRDAVDIAKRKYSNYLIDGELQLDAAIVPEVAKSKAPNSKVAGHANVLVFPDLDAGNIGYKLVQRLAKAEAYGPICQGILKPVNDLSRGCSVEDIVGVIAITVIQVDF